jgi:GMP synthase PP-ATPase subunit
VAADNFAISPDEKFMAITGCEKKKKMIFKNFIYVFEVKKMKRLSSTILKIQNSEGGSLS